jgi:hypothetical protein
MKLRNTVRYVLVAALVGISVQAGTAVFALVGTPDTATGQTYLPTQLQPQPLPNQPQTQAQTPTGTTSLSASAEIVIAPEVLEAIRASAPTNYERNTANYKQLLSRLDVHPKFRTEVERLLLSGRKAPDVLIAYEFLYQEFGTRTQLEALVTEKESGKSWELIFKGYRQAHAAFVPQAFDTDQLEELLRTSGLKSDDIMIADHLSFVTGKPFKELITARLEQKLSWKEAAAELDVLHTAAALPRVQITAEQINQWTQPGKMTEEQVAEAFVLASKSGEKPELVIGKLLDGQTQEAILAGGFVSKYE